MIRSIKPLCIKQAVKLSIKQLTGGCRMEEILIKLDIDPELKEMFLIEPKIETKGGIEDERSI